MESAELKSNKRVRHCYPRSEVYHRWVHNETLVYNSRTLPVWGKYNWLFTSACPSKKATKEDIIEAWGYHRTHCIAVIDRDKKKVLINTSYEKHWYDVKNAIPDDYEIFLTNKDIPTANILKDEEAYCKLHITHLIEHFTKLYVVPCYKVLNGYAKTLFVDIEDVCSKRYPAYNDIITFTKKYKLKRYAWAKESLNKAFKIAVDSKKWYITKAIEIPPLCKVYNKTIFSKKEKLTLLQRLFYTKYCYGNGISFKDVVEYWDKQINVASFKQYCNKRDINCNYNWLPIQNSWNEYVSSIIENQRACNINTDLINRKKSQQNYEEAINKKRQLLLETYTVDDWRAHKPVPAASYIEYERWITSYRKNTIGHWQTTMIPVNFVNPFNVVQLRLNTNKNRIETSKGAAVSLDDGIRLFKLFIKEVNSNKLINGYKCYENIKVGIYNLRLIAYGFKPTTSTTDASHKDWLIQVGCHDIWLEEVKDFIRYYHLEDKFGLPIEQKKIM